MAQMQGRICWEGVEGLTHAWNGWPLMKFRQESCAIAKMTARCALYISFSA